MSRSIQGSVWVDFVNPDIKTKILLAGGFLLEAQKLKFEKNKLGNQQGLELQKEVYSSSLSRSIKYEFLLSASTGSPATQKDIMLLYYDTINKNDSV